MRPLEQCADDDGSTDSDSSSSAEEWCVRDDAAPARTLAALNALRTARQHYDTVLVAGGVELPAHRAVLAAAAPHLAATLPPPAALPAVVRVDEDAACLRALLEYAYTGRLAARSAAEARRLYAAAYRLRVEGAAAALAERLLRRPTAAAALELRALPGLPAAQLRRLDEYIAEHFDEICATGAFAALPQLRVELLRESSAHDGEEAPRAVADAALCWLQGLPDHDLDVEELCSRTHLLYVNAGGALRDCGELPAVRGDAPELQEYRLEAAARHRRGRPAPAPPAPAACHVLAARSVGHGATRALLAVRGRLAAARLAWCGPGGAGTVARGGALGGEAGERRAGLARARAALGAAAADGQLLVVGGYDRAAVLAAAEAYDPRRNEWTPLPDLREPRARFPACAVGGALFVLGGSDGHAELDSVAALEGGAWRPRARLPLPLCHAAAAVDAARQELYVVGGWAGGVNLKRVFKYSPAADLWSEAPPLNTGRSQCGAALYEGALWALGGRDAWRCLASTERLPLGPGAPGPAPPGPAAPGDEAWAPGPALPTARRSMGSAAWRGRLVAAGGSDGAASLRRCDALTGDAWTTAPSLRRARAAHALVPLDDVLYAVGGFDGKEFLACVECLYEPDGEWTTLCAPATPPAPPTAPCEPPAGPAEPPDEEAS